MTDHRPLLNGHKHAPSHLLMSPQGTLTAPGRAVPPTVTA